MTTLTIGTRCWLLLVAGALALLAGCSNGSASNPPEEFSTVASVADRARADGAESAYQLLSDGDATLDEYTRAVADERTCLEDAGLAASEALVNPADGWRLTFEIGYNTVPAEDAVAIAQDCHVTSRYLALAYELSHEATMDPALMTAARACLETRGETTTGEERNLEDLMAGELSDSSRASAVSNCVLTEGVKMFPDREITVALQ